MCLSFYPSNSFLIRAINGWLVARKHFRLENHKLVSSYAGIPYEAYEVTLDDGDDYLRVINRDRLQPVNYSCLVINYDSHEGYSIMNVRRDHVLGYHASLLNDKLMVSSPEKFCLISNGNVWLPIVFSDDDVQMVSSEDIVVDMFYIPLSPKFYFDMATKLGKPCSFAKDFWLSVVFEVIETLNLSKMGVQK
jgi:hypothetical protein